ncbi:MAG: DUF2804 domain-containing protein [Bacillales bacterium]|nr:DUF2804 domain-containing protein [Bacillales bacterium]
MNNEHVLSEGDLLSSSGELIEAGYSTSLVKKWNKEVIKKHKIKLKEWDYYYFGNDKHAVALVIGDLQYIGQFGIVYFDFTKKQLIDKSKLLLFPCGKMNLPKDSSSSYLYKNKNDSIELKIMDDKKRRVIVHCDNVIDNTPLDVDVILTKTCNDSMVISTPFFKKRHFYYNQKINNFKVEGNVNLGSVNLNDKNDFMGVLDWGRGVWTYDNTWNWCSINAKYNGDYIGFNIGNGFGDTSNSSENMFFLNDKAYKLNQVDIQFSYINKKLNPQGKIIITSLVDDELYIEFTPIFNRHVDINAIFIKQLTNQMFGYFSGRVKYDNKYYNFNDLFGFIEKVHNKW